MCWLCSQCLAAEEPTNSESVAKGEAGVKVVELIQSPIQVRPRQPGAYENVIVSLDLAGVSSAEIRVTGYDIDAVRETIMTVNGTKIDLPPEIVADMQDRTVTVPVPEGVLKQGDNEIGFLFAEAVGGTSGFAIFGLQLILR